jgi:hypothetical protein
MNQEIDLREIAGTIDGATKIVKKDNVFFIEGVKWNNQCGCYDDYNILLTQQDAEKLVSELLQLITK